MFEKVNPSHPDKVADRIAGALVDLAYTKDENPKVAIEVLIGHGVCHIIAETSVSYSCREVSKIVDRIAGKVKVDFVQVPQDEHLAENQSKKIRCGDNGIFKGVPVTDEQKNLTKISSILYNRYKSDGKYIANGDDLIICQSNASNLDVYMSINNVPCFDRVYINPIGEWTGGTNVDCGATNRKLGSDMGDSVTGGGLHGKDLSKADVSLNICAFLDAQEKNETVELCCAIGDETVKNRPYSDYVEKARNYINSIGGFEKFAEYGLIRPVE